MEKERKGYAVRKNRCILCRKQKISRKASVDLEDFGKLLAWLKSTGVHHVGINYNSAILVRLGTSSSGRLVLIHT
eukprot:142800-Pelagomonas_calceolata.AAC.7